MSNLSSDYGWESEEAPESCGYLAPAVMKVLAQMGVKRVCDVGSGNGALAAEMRGAGFYVAGVEYDRRGVELSRAKYPEIRFYNLGVEDDAADVLRGEGARFDAVVSTEVIEHLFSPHLLPVFARQLLTDTGFLILSTPYHGYLKNLA